MNHFQLKFTSLDDTGSFEGMLSPYGNVDLGNDVVDPGAFTKTIQEKGVTRPLLWQHDKKQPIGQVTLVDTPDGMTVKGSLLLEVQKASEAYMLLKARIINGLSIGYDSVKDVVEDGVRHIKELKLWEASVVTFPMNELALISSVKDRRARGVIELKAQVDKVLADETIPRGVAKSYCADLLTEFDAFILESKSGRMISATNKSKLSAAREHMKGIMDCSKSADDILLSLLGLEAEPDADDAPKSLTSVAPAAEIKDKPEPAPDHSAITAAIAELKESYQWN
jgi:HK97 family phage prohead protease